MRKLASIRKIDEIRPIEGAIDRDKYPMTAILQDDFGRMWAVPVYELYRNFTYTGETSMTGREISMDAKRREVEAPLAVKQEHANGTD